MSYSKNSIKSIKVIPRILESRIERRLFKGKAIILLGPRQSGKTTLIQSIQKRRPEKILVLNGDETDVRELLSRTNSTRCAH